MSLIKPVSALAIFFAGIISIIAPVKAEESIRISVSFHGRMFNSVASDYLERPTFVSIEKRSGDEMVLVVRVTKLVRDQYGLDYTEIRFLKTKVDDYLALVNKFNEWEALATTRGDTFTKDIDKAEVWGSFGRPDVQFTFHSGNATHHFLVLKFCAMGTCLNDSGFVLSADDAKNFATTLKQFQSGEIKQNEIDSVYK